jgi:hypothetical protein
MRFKSRSKVQPELVASKDSSRPVLTTVHLNAAKSRVEVTDSYMLAVFPVDLDEGDTSGPIPVDALKASRKAPLKHVADRAGTSIRCNSHVEVRHAFGEEASEPYLTLPRDSSDYTFPNVDHLFPDDLSDFEIGLDAEKLHKLAKAMGDMRVRIRFCNSWARAEGNGAFGPSNMRPFVVCPLGASEDDARGILMPIRISS